MAKQIDLILRVDPNKHQHLLLALNEYGHTFTATTPTIAPNTLIGIEVEITESTVANNVTKDIVSAGITTLILAVMPKHVDKVRRQLPTMIDGTLLERVILIDALKLLDALRANDTNRGNDCKP